MGKRSSNRNSTCDNGHYESTDTAVATEQGYIVHDDDDDNRDILPLPDDMDWLRRVRLYYPKNIITFCGKGSSARTGAPARYSDNHGRIRNRGDF